MILPRRHRERKETQGNVFHLFFWEALRAKDFTTKSTKEIHAKNTKGSLNNTDFLTTFEIRASLRHCAFVQRTLRAVKPLRSLRLRGEILFAKQNLRFSPELSCPHQYRYYDPLLFCHLPVYQSYTSIIRAEKLPAGIKIRKR